MKNIIAKNISNSTIVASSENPGYPFDTGLNDSRLSRPGRTLSNTGQWVKFSFSSAVSVDVVGVFGNNFTTSATVKIQANTSDSWSSPPIDQTLTYSKEKRKSVQLGRSIGVWSHQFTSTQSYQYWRVTVDDPTNTDDYIQIGFMYLDEETIFPGMAINQNFKRNTTSEAFFSESGQAYGLKRLQYDTASFNYPSVTETQRTTVDEFFYEVDTVVPYMMLPWENDLDIQEPLHVINLSLPEWPRNEQRAGLLWSTNHEIRRVY